MIKRQKKERLQNQRMKLQLTKASLAFKRSTNRLLNQVKEVHKQNRRNHRMSMDG